MISGDTGDAAVTRSSMISMLNSVIQIAVNLCHLIFFFMTKATDRSSDFPHHILLSMSPCPATRVTWGKITSLINEVPLLFFCIALLICMDLQKQCEGRFCNKEFYVLNVITVKEIEMRLIWKNVLSIRYKYQKPHGNGGI